MKPTRAHLKVYLFVVMLLVVLGVTLGRIFQGIRKSSEPDTSSDVWRSEDDLRLLESSTYPESDHRAALVRLARSNPPLALQTFEKLRIDPKGADIDLYAQALLEGLPSPDITKWAQDNFEKFSLGFQEKAVVGLLRDAPGWAQQHMKTLLHKTGVSYSFRVLSVFELEEKKDWDKRLSKDLHPSNQAEERIVIDALFQKHRSSSLLAPLCQKTVTHSGHPAQKSCERFLKGQL